MDLHALARRTSRPLRALLAGGLCACLSGCGGARSPGATAVTTSATPAEASAPVSAVASAPPPLLLDSTVLQALLLPLVQESAPGMTAEGPPITGVAVEGQPLTQMVTLQPGGRRCYTAIAGAAPPVTDVVLELWASPPSPLPRTLVAQSQGRGDRAVLAGSPSCFRNLLPVPVTATLQVTSRAGSGSLLAQLYAR